MSKGEKDIELLATLINNDSPRLAQIIDRLRKEARSIAIAKLDAEDVEDATSQTIDKAIDWLRSDAPFKANYPMGYVKKLITNAIIDYGRTHKGEAAPEHEIRKALPWIDEGMGYSGEDEEGDMEAGTGGWHGIKSKNRPLYITGTAEYPEHPWLKGLNRLERYESWFWNEYKVYDYLKNKLRGTGVKVTYRLAFRFLKSKQDRRWQQYKLIMALINNIPSLGEQEIIKYYLWGYRVTDIHQKLDVTKPYISKVVSKWMKAWGWDKLERDKMRIILLTNYLANIYPSSWRKAVVKVIPDFFARRPKYMLPRHISLRQEQEIEKEMQDDLHDKVVSAPRTRVYLSNLKKSDDLGLIETCALCYAYWYGKIGE